MVDATDMISTARKLQSHWAPWPSFTDEEVAAAQRVLISGRVNQWTGSEVWSFEREYATSLNRGHAVAVMNGTVALELALHAFGVGVGDEVITTPRTFIASASAAVMRGAVPVLADVDRDSGNITPETIEGAITPRSRAIIVVHLAGWPADMSGIMELATERGLVVIEDCAQAHGASVGGRQVGSYGHAAAFSFCQDKIITTGGEGGLVALDDEVAWNRAWSYKDHGKDFDTVFNKRHERGFRWLHESFGTNWRMLEIQAAIGRVQLGRLEQSIAARNKNAELLRGHLAPLDALRVPTVDSDDTHAYYKFYAYVRPEALRAGWSRDKVMQRIEEAGIPVSTGSCSEIYREVAFVNSGFATNSPLAVARELGETALMFQVHPTLAPEALHEAGCIVADIVREATR